MNKVYASAAEALAGVVRDGQTGAELVLEDALRERGYY